VKSAVAAFLALGCVLGFAAEPAGAADSSGVKSADLKLSIPYQGVGVDLMVLWTAVDQRLFQRYGIDATTEYIPQSPIIVASILSGETLFANVGQDAVISADLNGGDLVILASGPDRLPFIVYAAPSIRRVADLKGKKIGISAFGTSTDFVARYVLKQAGLDAGKDATLIPVGAQANRLTTLQSGAVDATIVAFPGNIEAARLGFVPIADMADYPLRFYTGSLVGQKSWVAAHRNDTLNVVRGYVAGIAAVIRDKKAALAALAKYSKTNDPEMLDAGYRELMKVLTKVPTPDPAVLRAGMENLQVKTSNDPASFVDPSFTEELKRDGFIDSLYRAAR
jgi:ABC-type nitrate/sulfonate/bicarbonate transport system substrate-binding protein